MNNIFFKKQTIDPPPQESNGQPLYLLPYNMPYRIMDSI